MQQTGLLLMEGWIVHDVFPIKSIYAYTTLLTLIDESNLHDTLKNCQVILLLYRLRRKTFGGRKCFHIHFHLAKDFFKNRIQASDVNLLSHGVFGPKITLLHLSWLIQNMWYSH